MYVSPDVYQIKKNPCNHIYDQVNPFLGKSDDVIMPIAAINLSAEVFKRI
jgi:hypothetical protein